MMTDQNNDYRERTLDLMAEAIKLATPAFDPMTNLRDWFAGMAVVGILAGDHAPAGCDDQTWERNIAREAYRMADAMISARSKDGER